MERDQVEHGARALHEQDRDAGVGAGVAPLAAQVLALQRSHGNAAVVRALARSAPPAATDADVSTASWQRVQGHAFLSGAGDAATVAANDVRQGQAGDCYFLASCAAVALANPAYITRLIHENGDGTFRVALWDEEAHHHGFLGLGGTTYTRSRWEGTLNDRFLTIGGAPRYAKVSGDTDTAGASELWVMLLEKMWAYHEGRSYQRIGGGDTARTERALTAVSGAHCRSYQLNNSLSDQELANRMQNYVPNKHAVVTGIDTVPSSWQATAQSLSVVQNHVYAVEGVNATAKTIDLYNPWGYRHLRGLPIASWRAMFTDFTMTESQLR